MKFLISLLFCSSLYGGIGVYSNYSISQQGVGFRANISVAKYCVLNDQRPACVTGDKATLFSDQLQVYPLGNPFRSQGNGFYQFFVEAGWYDVLVSGLGIANYGFRVFVNDGSITTTVGAITFNLCSSPCVVSASVGPPYILTSNTVTISKCYISGRVLPTGQSVVVDILKNGTSIFQAGLNNKLVFNTAGDTGVQTVTVTGAEFDIFTPSIVQVGSGTAGTDITVTCRGLFQ